MNDTVKIIVHGGQAHLDEIVAAALVVYKEVLGKPGMFFGLERREPTEEELADKNVFVLDVGGRHQPELRNFDHHQRNRDEEPECAYCLVAEYYGLWETMKKLFPWAETWNSIDVQGPFAWARANGVDWNVAKGLLWPAATELFTELPKSVVYSIATMLKLNFEAFNSVSCGAFAPWDLWENNDMSKTVVDFRKCDPVGAEAVSGAVLAARFPKAQVAVFHDNRGPGLTLLRINDDPHWDFSRAKDVKGVVFAHAGGFIAKLATKDDDLIRKVLKAAYQEVS